MGLNVGTFAITWFDRPPDGPGAEAVYDFAEMLAQNAPALMDGSGFGYYTERELLQEAKYYCQAHPELGADEVRAIIRWVLRLPYDEADVVRLAFNW